MPASVVLTAILLISIQFDLLMAMSYFKVEKGTNPGKWEEEHGTLSLSEIKILCHKLGSDCPFGFFCQDGNCRIVASDWTGATSQDIGVIFFKKVQTCNEKQCGNLCWDKDFVDNNDQRTECCPKLKCGKNCEKDQFVKLQGYDTPNFDIGDAKLYSEDQCYDLCLEKDCETMIHKTNQDCWVKNSRFPNYVRFEKCGICRLYYKNNC